MGDEVSDEAARRPAPETRRSGGTVSTADDEPTADGRNRRRRRNVDAVLDAVVGLAAEGIVDPTSEVIAERAGVSHRSIYRYFGTRTALLEAAVARALEVVSDRLFFTPVGEGTLEDRIERFVDARVETHTALRQIARAAFSRHAEATMPDEIESIRSALRGQLADQFAPELAHLDGAERAEVVAVLDVAVQFEALEYLTGSAGLDVDGVRRALTTHLRAHLG